MKPVSRSRVDPFSVVAVVDRETGEQGVVFQLGPRAWVSETEVHVTGGYYFNGIAALEHLRVRRAAAGPWSTSSGSGSATSQRALPPT